jgi:hypothetical protein
MRFLPQHAELLTQKAETILANGQPKELQVHELWTTLAHFQAMVLAQKLAHTVGNKVMAGPFKGMQLTPDAMTGIFGPYLSGSYEYRLRLWLLCNRLCITHATGSDPHLRY